MRRHKRLLPPLGKPVKMSPYFSVGNRLTVQGDEMKLTVLVPALAGLLWAGSALADAQLEVTNPYVAQLIDGQPINPKLLDKSKLRVPCFVSLVLAWIRSLPQGNGWWTSKIAIGQPCRARLH